MSKWTKLRDFLRLGAAVAGASGVTVKGVPVAVIAEEAEKDGALIADSVKRMKDARPPKPKLVKSSTGD